MISRRRTYWLFVISSLSLLLLCASAMAQNRQTGQIEGQISLTLHRTIETSRRGSLAGVVSSDSKYIAATSYDTVLSPYPITSVWILSTGEVVDSVDIGDGSALYGLSFSPDGSYIAGRFPSSDALLKWDFLDPESGSSTLNLLNRHARNAPTPAFLFAPDGKSIYHSPQGGPIVRIELTTLDTLQKLIGHRAPIISLQYNSDSTRLLSVSLSDRSVRMWDLGTGREEFVVQFPDTLIPYGASLSPDGNRCVISIAGYYDGEGMESHLLEYDGHTGELLQEFPKPDSVLLYDTYLSYSPDGSVIVGIDWDPQLIKGLLNVLGRGILFWDAKSGTLLGKMDIPDGKAYSWFTFSQDGQYLVMGNKTSPEIDIWKWEPIGSSVKDAVTGESRLILHEIRPNPAHDRLEIPFRLSRPGNVVVSFVDLKGNPIGEKTEEVYREGEHVITMNMEMLPTGTYFVVLTTSEGQQMRPVQVLH